MPTRLPAEALIAAELLAVAKAIGQHAAAWPVEDPLESELPSMTGAGPPH